MSQLVASLVSSEPSDHSPEVDPSILIADNTGSQTMEFNMSSSSFNNNHDGDFNEAGSLSAIHEELDELDVTEGVIEDFPEA